MNYPKRLIEIDLPIRKISEQARREKSIRHGHISTLHIWWARRPLVACRAVICAALWPDPGDHNCPDGFRTGAARLMKTFRDKRGGKLYDWSSGTELRKALLDFIADFANWDNSTNKDFLDTSRELTRIAHESLGGEPGTQPMVVDPFAGGGSIPLEALRVGADTFASDLNPVAVLLNKVVLEYIPKYGQKLADEVRKWGQWIKKEAEKELAEFYPKDPDGATPIAYLWARTIKCEGPGCGADVPLMKGPWLVKKDNRSVAMRLVPDKKNKRVEFQIIENAKANDVGEGTVRRSAVTCPICRYTTPPKSVRQQLSKKRGGTHDAKLIAVVTLRDERQGRGYRLPTKEDNVVIESARKRLEKLVKTNTGLLSLIPDEPMDTKNANLVSGRGYGVKQWGELFLERQLLSLLTLRRTLDRVQEQKIHDGSDPDFAKAIITLLALILDRQVDFSSAYCRWVLGEFIAATLGGEKQIPMMWDFAEGNPCGEGSGNFLGAVDWVARVIDNLTASRYKPGHIQRCSATSSPLPDDFAHLLFTDPPYYDAITYADISDFFYVWLKRSIGNLYKELFAYTTTPKEDELVVYNGFEGQHKKDKHFFEQGMFKAMSEARRYSKPNSLGIVVFAHKTTEGWEALLESIISAGWILTSSWPIDTERAVRRNAIGTAALASSIHVVCRPRENPDGLLRTDEVGDWRDVLAELPKRIHEWMPRLAEEGVVGADAIFACLGPALEIFSCYSRVEKASGEVVPLKEYLEHVWAAVAKEALNMIFEGAETMGFEEDARLTAMWLWTLSAGATNGNGGSASEEETTEEGEEDEDKPSSKAKLSGYTLEYDAARKIAQGLGAHLERLQSLVEVKGDKARLLPVAERTRALFGREEAEAPRAKNKKKEQISMFDEIEEAEESGSWGAKNVPQLGNTTLDRLHQSMILFAAGRGEALKRFLVDEGVGRDERFWRLAQALSALYPKNADEKRWVDGVLARKKGLGL